VAYFTKAIKTDDFKNAYSEYESWDYADSGNGDYTRVYSPPDRDVAMWKWLNVVRALHTEYDDADILWRIDYLREQHNDPTCDEESSMNSARWIDRRALIKEGMPPWKATSEILERDKPIEEE
jgi:hypothetical protein